MRAQIETGGREERAATLDSVEFRKDDESGELKFEGHAAVFDEWTEIPTLFGSTFMERIQRGAFRKVLSDGADVRFLGLNHNPDLVMARTGPATLRLKEDTKGLKVNADLDSRDPDVQSLSVKLERGDVSQMSFGFRVGKHEVEYDEDEDITRRTITEFSDLFDVSPVTFPAYEGTDASLRACGVQLVNGRGDVDEGRLLDLALKIFRGEKQATDEERAAIDGVFAMTDIVSPWMAERAARAYSQEPELRAALQGSGITIEVGGLPPEEPPVGGCLSTVAARRWLDVLAA